MNFFYLDEDPWQSIEYHCDKHLIKMILESAQLLCTAHWISEYVGHIPRKLTSEEWNEVKKHKTIEPRPFAYLPTMHNHPCTIWARTTLDNYEWLVCYAIALNEEYRYRYGKDHKSVCNVILKLPEPVSLPRDKLTPFAQAMPDELKGSDGVKAYRRFYHKDKATFATWKGRDRPPWWVDNEASYEQRITR